MKVEIEYMFNASNLAGKNLVTFEKLYDLCNPDEPKKVTEHKDIKDNVQAETIKEKTRKPSPTKNQKTCPALEHQIRHQKRLTAQNR